MGVILHLVTEAGGYASTSTVVKVSKTSAVIAMYDFSTTRVFVRYKTSYIAIIALVLLHECSPLTTVDLKP